jgi:glycosyltransferase involved in cell wall biosynthesis
MKTISIITPCYNEEASVEECVETVSKLFAKELPNYAYEHIFCDNCSTDRTVEILKGIAKTNPSVKIIVN